MAATYLKDQFRNGAAIRSRKGAALAALPRTALCWALAPEERSTRSRRDRMKVTRQFTVGNVILVWSKVPSGTAETRPFSRSFGTEIANAANPPLKWRATFTMSLRDSWKSFPGAGRVFELSNAPRPGRWVLQLRVVGNLRRTDCQLPFFRPPRRNCLPHSLLRSGCLGIQMPFVDFRLAGPQPPAFRSRSRSRGIQVGMGARGLITKRIDVIVDRLSHVEVGCR